jgi:hypothetical protein
LLSGYNSEVVSFHFQGSPEIRWSMEAAKVRITVYEEGALEILEVAHEKA